MTEIHALSGAYAVDAVDAVERARFQRHLTECAACRAEVASLREAAATLAHDAAVAPPAALRDRVLAGITTVRPLPPETPVTPVAPETAGAPAAGPTSGPDPAGRIRRWVPALAAAVVLAVVGVGAAVWQPWQTDQAPTLTAAERVLRADDAAGTTLTFPGGAQATLVLSESEHHAVLVTEAMPAAPAGKVYQLWFDVPGEGMVSAGVMPPKADQTVLLDGETDTATGAGITVEPAGGSPTPTGDPIALFDFAELEPQA